MSVFVAPPSSWSGATTSTEVATQLSVPPSTSPHETYPLPPDGGVQGWALHANVDWLYAMSNLPSLFTSSIAAMRAPANAPEAGSLGSLMIMDAGGGVKT